MQAINLIVELAREVEVTDPIDWGMLDVSEEDAYKLVALKVYEDYPKESILIHATITKLVVENFVLNLKLLQK